MVIFTDLDGTLLDLMDRSVGPALPILQKLQQRGIPVIFCSAKTRAEQERLRRELNVCDPFIVENGGAVFIPREYFPFSFPCQKTVEEYHVLELGAPYTEIRALIGRIRHTLGVEFQGFGDLAPGEIARRTGLSQSEAVRAAAREYDETLFLQDLSDEERGQILRAVKEAGMRWTHGGRFYHVMGANDKGRAVRLVAGLYERLWGLIRTVGLGDSRNDWEMLKAVDIPVLVEKYEGGWEDIALPALPKVPGKGPLGWRRVVESLVL